jgi:hypothetical protein
MQYQYRDKNYVFIFNRPEDFGYSFVTVYEEKNP